MSLTASFQREMFQDGKLTTTRINNYQTSILLHPKFLLARLLSSFQYGCQFNVMELPKNQQKSKQARNQEFFMAGEFFRIRKLQQKIIYSTKKKGPGRNSLRFFLLEILKSCTLDKKFNPQMTTIRVSPKISTLFSYFRKGQERPPSLPPLLTRLENTILIIIKFCLFLLRGSTFRSCVIS